MSDAVAKRPGSRKIYDTHQANKLIADILVVSDRFAAQNPQTMIKFADGWLEGVQFIKSQPARAYTLIGSIKDFNIPTDLAKTMLEGVVLADAADNKAFFGSAGAASDYSRIFKAAQQMYQETGVLKGAPADPEASVDRKVVTSL
jgi:ABC-type nitrate/sulfonate/bicarbonate transport system substrate-binding protein